MSLAELSLELIQIIASYLDLPELNALIQTQKCFARGLTAQLYNRALQVTDDVKGRIFNWGGLPGPHGVFCNDRIWRCIPEWSSGYIVDYFLQRRGENFGNPPPPDMWLMQVVPLLCALAGAGNVDVLRAMILAGDDIEVRDEDSRTPLLWAVNGGHERVVKCLLDEGADVLVVDMYGSSVVHAACHNVSSSTRAILTRLIEETKRAGGDFLRPNNRQMTPLHVAATYGNEDTVQLLLERGMSPLVTDLVRNRLARFSIRRGHDKLSIFMVQKILDAHGDISQSIDYGRTLLHTALTRKCGSLAKFLIKAGADVSAPDQVGVTPLHIAVGKRDFQDVVELLVEAGASPCAQHNDRPSPLELALDEEMYDYVQLLLRGGPQLWPESHINARLWKIAGAAASAEEAGGSGLVDLIVMLAKTGESALEMVDDDGDTALHYLCSAWREGYRDSASGTEAVQLLIDAGIELARKNRRGFTPLHLAVSGSKTSAIRLLLASGTVQPQPELDSLVRILAELGMGNRELAIDDEGYAPLDRVVMKLEDKNSRASLGKLLGWGNI